jgi:hypothetical protein
VTGVDTGLLILELSSEYEKIRGRTADDGLAAIALVEAFDKATRQAPGAQAGKCRAGRRAIRRRRIKEARAVAGDSGARVRRRKTGDKSVG